MPFYALSLLSLPPFNVLVHIIQMTEVGRIRGAKRLPLSLASSVLLLICQSSWIYASSNSSRPMHARLHWLWTPGVCSVGTSGLAGSAPVAATQMRDVILFFWLIRGDSSRSFVFTPVPGVTLLTLLWSGMKSHRWLRTLDNSTHKRRVDVIPSNRSSARLTRLTLIQQLKKPNFLSWSGPLVCIHEDQEQSLHARRVFLLGFYFAIHSYTLGK